DSRRGPLERGGSSARDLPAEPTGPCRRCRRHAEHRDAGEQQGGHQSADDPASHQSTPKNESEPRSRERDVGWTQVASGRIPPFTPRAVRDRNRTESTFAVAGGNLRSKARERYRCVVKGCNSTSERSSRSDSSWTTWALRSGIGSRTSACAPRRSAKTRAVS